MSKGIVKIQGTGKDIFDLLVIYSKQISNYFEVDEEDLTFSQVLEYFDTFQQKEFGLVIS